MITTASTVVRRVADAAQIGVLAVLSWLRAEDVTDDRGSDSSEKAFMVILAIGIGTAVSVAAVTFVATKTALFR